MTNGYQVGEKWVGGRLNYCDVHLITKKSLNEFLKDPTSFLKLKARDCSQKKKKGGFTLTLISYSLFHFCLYLEMGEYQ